MLSLTAPDIFNVFPCRDKLSFGGRDPDGAGEAWLLAAFGSCFWKSVRRFEDIYIIYCQFDANHRIEPAQPALRRLTTTPPNISSGRASNLLPDFFEMPSLTQAARRETGASQSSLYGSAFVTDPLFATPPGAISDPNCLDRAAQKIPFAAGKIEVIGAKVSPATFRTVALIASALTSALGLIVLFGWWLNVDALRCVIPGSTPLKPNIALAFVLSGVALTILCREAPSKLIRGCAAGLALIVVIAAAVTLIEHSFNWDLGADNLLVRQFPASLGAVNPGRMQPTTAFCLLLGGCALLSKSLLAPRRFVFPLVAGFGGSLIVIGVTALIGFFLEQQFGPQLNLLGMTVSGISAAIGLLLLGAGLLALLRSKSELSWWLDTFTSTGFLIAIVLTVVTTAASFSFARKMLETHDKVAHRQEVLKVIQQIITGMTQLGSGERAYIIIVDENLLKERGEQKAAVKTNMAELRKLTSDNPTQQRYLDRLDDLIPKRLGFEDQVIAAARQTGFASAAQMIATRTGITFWNHISGIFAEMQKEEYRLLSIDRRQAQTASTATFLLLPMGLFLSIAILSLAVFFLNSGMGERIRSLLALRKSEAQLHTIVENLDEGLVVSDLNGRLLQWNRAALKLHGYDSSEQDRRGFTELVDTFELTTLDDSVVPVEEWPLARVLRGDAVHDLELCVRRFGTEWQRVFNFGGTLVHDQNGKPMMAIVTLNDITERKRAESEVLQLNLELEKRVETRTAQLEAANKELEAFSYSVSHDLRAPLRAVDGFSQAVLEDYGPRLPDGGRRYLQTIRESAQRMGVLIDDLLTFSRLSRLPLNKQQINTSRMVRDALEDLKSYRNDRQIDVRFGDLPPCIGDPALLKQVWVNLLSNALKYTRNRAAAVVDIGSRNENGRDVYFVSDNGTGFDMQYAHKLFGVFQRLHRDDEFEGTGVGLAIVQRIVARHGGRVWTKAEPDRGATFFFTLGSQGET